MVTVMLSADLLAYDAMAGRTMTGTMRRPDGRWRLHSGSFQRLQCAGLRRGNLLKAEVSLSLDTHIPCTLRERRSEGGEAVQDGGPDLKLGVLVVEVARRDALTKPLETAHLCFDHTPSVIAGLALPDDPAKAAAPAVTIPRCWLLGMWFSGSSSMGASPTRLPVISLARISSVSASIPC